MVDSKSTKKTNEREREKSQLAKKFLFRQTFSSFSPRVSFCASIERSHTIYLPLSRKNILLFSYHDPVVAKEVRIRRRNTRERERVETMRVRFRLLSFFLPEKKKKKRRRFYLTRKTRVRKKEQRSTSSRNARNGQQQNERHNPEQRQLLLASAFHGDPILFVNATTTTTRDDFHLRVTYENAVLCHG